MLPGRQVTLVEDEEEDGQDAGDPGLEILRGRHPVRDASRLDLGLRAGDPLRHGGLLDQEGTHDLGHGQAGDHPQRQRHAGLHRERRVAAGEDQPEPLILDGAGRPGRVVVVQQLSFLVLAGPPGLAPDPVDGRAGGRHRGERLVHLLAAGLQALDALEDRAAGQELGAAETGAEDVQQRVAAGLLASVHRTLYAEASRRSLAGERREDICEVLATTATRAFDLLEPALGSYGIRATPGVSPGRDRA